ncbi:P-loop containing nucleoside triphosphate hydrolase protein [Ramaria rubella]|nr:P-loop containing nucleoside triphosphate hydrolase protein [Ramaria rubella]
MASQALLNALADFLPPSTQVAGVSPQMAVPSLSNATNATTAESSFVHDLSFFSVPSLLLSLAFKNQDFLKLVLIGGLIETFRRFADRAWNWFLNTWFITAYFDNSDDTFEWMMIWLAKQSVWAKAREVHISTASWGQTHHKGVEIPGDSGAKDAGEAGFQTKRKLAFLPAFGAKHWLRYKGTWMTVSRSQSDPRDAWSGRKEESLQISLFTRDHRVLRSLLLDAKKIYKAEDEDTVEIYGADSYNQWYRTSTRKKRPLRSIVLEPEVKNMILDDAKDFLSTEKWYTDRGIPYRRGYLLHGVPGSGKTSLIHSIAGELGLDIYVVSLAKKGLDDSSLNELICGLPLRSIALMEDIDAAFHHAATARSGVSGSTSTPESTLASGGPPAPPNAPKEPETKGVTLSGLLGALDGVAAQEGRILFATTNRYESLDEALCRPGRMDVHVEFKKATQWQARELFLCFFPPVDEDEDEDEDKVAEKPREDGKVTLRAKLTKVEADELAAEFAAGVPAGQFSMASLQGHLMRFKERPREAVAAVAEWVERESQKRGAIVKDSAVLKEGTIDLPVCKDIPVVTETKAI